MLYADTRSVERRLTFVGPDVSGWSLLSQSRLRISNSACHLPRLTE